MKRKVRVYGGVQRPEIGNEKRWENGRSLMSTRLDEIADWKPKASGGLKSDDNEYGFPTHPADSWRNARKPSMQDFSLRR